MKKFFSRQRAFYLITQIITTSMAIKLVIAVPAFSGPTQITMTNMVIKSDTVARDCSEQCIMTTPATKLASLMLAFWGIRIIMILMDEKLAIRMIHC